ncbi:MAG: enoyl-CoA hydratase/isomerase family protein [Betaproteobacteria bacterium]|nr:MAG: enoyl-CoA hydratase/isomerase family protein [Betaproteobacteria bacterium]
MSNYQTLELETHRDVAVIWMNRPDVRNAFNETMIAELSAAFRSLDADDEVKAVVLAGRGKSFCAGADLNWMKKMSGYSAEQNYEDALGLASMLHTLYSMTKPTIARVHGHAFAGGMGLVSACDMAVAAFEAEFCLSEVKIGLIPATIGPYVVAAMGSRACRRYMVTGERFAASEAYRVGLVHEIAPLDKIDEKIDELLIHLVVGGSAAHAKTKSLIDLIARSTLGQTLMEETAQRIAQVRASEEGKEGIRSFLDKRKPNWVPGD